VSDISGKVLKDYRGWIDVDPVTNSESDRNGSNGSISMLWGSRGATLFAATIESGVEPPCSKTLRERQMLAENEGFFCFDLIHEIYLVQIEF
jgi:hypothetical protein